MRVDLYRHGLSSGESSPWVARETRLARKTHGSRLGMHMWASEIRRMRSGAKASKVPGQGPFAGSRAAVVGDDQWRVEGDDVTACYLGPDDREDLLIRQD